MRVKCFFLALVVLSTFFLLSFAQAQRPIVRLIYFLPSDRHPQPDINEKMDKLIKDVQQFYADQMEAHGFGRKTFQFEMDVIGNAVVHQVDGQFADAYYHDGTSSKIFEEISERFDLSKNVYFTAVDISSKLIGTAAGVASSLGSSAGLAAIPASGRFFNHPLAAHEIGHTFGLGHNFETTDQIMSYGPWPWRHATKISQCAAEWLNVHRLFNVRQSQTAVDAETTIQMLSSLVFPPNDIRLRFRVIDADGLYQAQLFTPFGYRGSSLTACKGLNGKNSTIEFVTTDLTVGPDSYAILKVIDVHGNFRSEFFPLDTTISLNSDMVFPDANLRLKIMEALGKPSEATITVTDMLTLTTLNADSADINEIEGLQYAYNLRTLTLNNNNIADVDLIASLTQLTTLSIDNNDIADVAAISTLNQLETLSLENNKISDIAPIEGLTELKTLHIKGNLLNYTSHYRFILAMQERGVEIAFEMRTPAKLIKKPSSTHGLTGSKSSVIVMVQDENEIAFSEVPVTFTVTTANGHLSIVETVTDQDGTARAALMLGPAAGENTVRTSVPEVPQPLIFAITAIDANTFVHIPDENLRTKIANALGRSRNSQLTAEDMSKLTKLEAPNANIQNLTGIEYAYNLKELNLGVEYIDGVGSVNNNTISDFSPLETLSQLTYLDLSGSSLSDISFTVNLIQLKELDLWNNTISDISALSGLTQLEILNLSYNAISDISALSGLIQLSVLYFRHNAISDISALSGLTQLSVLYLQHNAISDVSPLVTLNLTGTYVYPDRRSGFQTEGLKIKGNPLSYASINTHIPAMQAKGIEVVFDDTAHPALIKIVGDGQTGTSGVLLASPFVVEVQDESAQPMKDVSVTFTIHSGGGILSPTTTQTDADGKARATLTLGWTPGTTTVHATAAGFKSYVLFKATATVLTDHIMAEDVNGDGVIDVEDLVLVAASFGAVPIPGVLPSTDVNGDGKINNEDVLLVLAALEATSTPAGPSFGTQPTVASLQHWIAEAKLHSTRDTTFQRGILILEQLLAALTPEETALLPNYPNPFNPETWIPYQLAKPVDVKISIYAVDGTLVRTLDVGHQSVGIYESKNRAAYWDGRNALGEPVASGVYFFTLTAGEFTATRRMLIRK